LNKKERINLIRELESELAYGRFVHTLNVACTAANLAMCYGSDIDQADTAGLLHDCAKCMNLGKMLKLCDKADLELSEFEKNSASLLHSKAGAVLAASKYGIRDEDILNAIRYHTTGRPGMSLLEKIIFVSDYIEPGRDSAPNLPLVRKLAFESIDDCVLQILKDTLGYLGTTGAEVDPMTQKTYDYYRRCDEERKFYE
jgi:predicted HD superfamily hydrolase involved in NAD metabolism